MATRGVLALLVGTGLLALATIAVGAEHGEAAVGGGISPVPTSWEQFGSDLATTLNIVYESVYFQLFIYFVVLFHAINGLRILAMDTWPKLLRFQKEVIWMEWLIFIPVYGLTAFIMINNAISGV